ncbi:MAG TPA: FAD-dependent oxidoreductase [Cyclobacteriaceae bacterium]|nr:FAD-dependent oxidoreductase [Cyclobacteriaceae bacterium]
MQEASTNTFSPRYDSISSFSFTPCKPGGKIIVIGAGAFGGWSALFLLRKKYHVTLIDSWGPGNSRSSSGDETRVIRSTYGRNKLYFDLNVRSLGFWKALERQTGVDLFSNKGVLWLCHKEHAPIVDDSIPFAASHNMGYEYVSNEELKRKYSILNITDLHHAYHDPFGGFLKARDSCMLINQLFISEGGEYLASNVRPGKIHQNKLKYIELSDGSQLSADAFVFACGSWLGNVFPQVLRDVITCSKQEVYYFGVPYKDADLYENFPVWIDLDGLDFYYGIPSNNGRGFKIGVDKRGETFDPTNDERVLSPEVLREARTFIAHRFPGLQDAPLLENRVCPYENSPDGNFIIDHHPDADNVIIAGGGSGHGFKHGPAIGELITDGLSGNGQIPGLSL